MTARSPTGPQRPKDLGGRLQHWGGVASKWGNRALLAGAGAGLTVAGTRFLASGGKSGGVLAARTLSNLTGFPKWTTKAVRGLRRSAVGKGAAALAAKFAANPQRQEIAGAAEHIMKRAKLHQIGNEAIHYGGLTMAGGFGAQLGGMALSSRKKRGKLSKTGMLMAADDVIPAAARAVGGMGKA